MILRMFLAAVLTAGVLMAVADESVAAPVPVDIAGLRDFTQQEEGGGETEPEEDDKTLPDVIDATMGIIGDDYRKVAATGTTISGTAENRTVFKVDMGGTLANNSDAAGTGLKVDRYATLLFDTNSRYTGTGPVRVWYEGEMDDAASAPTLIIRDNIAKGAVPADPVDPTDPTDPTDPVDPVEPDTRILPRADETDGAEQIEEVDEVDDTRGQGLKELLANTQLGQNGVLRIGGATFTHELSLEESSEGGKVYVDMDSVFENSVDFRKSDLYVSGASGTAEVYFNKNVAARTVRVENARMNLANGSQVTAGTFSVGASGELRVTGNAGISGNARFESGSALTLGAGTLTIGGDLTFESGSVYNAYNGGQGPSLVYATGDVGIEQNVLLYVGGDNQSVAVNKVVLETEKDITGIFESKVYDLEKVLGENGNYGIKVTGLKGGKDIDVPDDKSVKGALELYDRLKNDPNTPESLVAGIASQLEKATVLQKTDPVQGGIALRQTLGNYATRQAEAARETARQFAGGVGSRLTALHDNAGAPVYYGGTPIVTMPVAGSTVANGSLCYPTSCEEKVDRFWLGGFGGWTKQNDRGTELGYKYDSRGIIAGYDWQRGDVTIGISGAFGSGDLKNNEGYTKTDIETVNVGMYASYDPVSGFFADANIGYGHSWNKTRTQLLTGGEKGGRYATHSFGGGANVGYVWSWHDTFRITPTVGVQWTRVHQNGWTESASDSTIPSLWFDENDTDYVEVPLAVRVSKAFQLSNGSIITPEARAAYIYEAGDSTPTVRTGFVGSTDSTLLYGVNPGKGRALVGGGIKANINSSFDAFVDYNLEFRKGYRNNSVTTGVGVSF